MGNVKKSSGLSTAQKAFLGVAFLAGIGTCVAIKQSAPTDTSSFIKSETVTQVKKVPENDERAIELYEQARKRELRFNKALKGYIEQHGSASVPQNSVIDSDRRLAEHEAKLKEIRGK